MAKATKLAAALLLADAQVFAQTEPGLLITHVGCLMDAICANIR